MNAHEAPQAGVPTCYRHPGRETYIRCQRCERSICPDCMHDAAVGFQCPSCVAEGAKTTRSGRTAYGGIRPGNPGLTTLVLIGTNAIIWLMLLASGGDRSKLYNVLALLPEGRCVPTEAPDSYFPAIGSETVCEVQGHTWAEGVADGAYWQLVTNAFTHVEVWHIGFNMLAVWFLGPQLELALGRVRFLALYFLAAVGGSTMVYWFAATTGSTVGASGVVYGLLGALLLLAYKVGGNVQPILVWLGLGFLITVVGRGFISWQGHLGGFLAGLAVAAVLIYAPRERRTTWQALGLSTITAGLVLAVVARTLALT